MSGNQVLAETSQVDLYLVEEATYGVTPATARAQEMRFTSSGLKRLGFTVTKLMGNSPERNRIRRRLKIGRHDEG